MQRGQAKTACPHCILEPSVPGYFLAGGGGSFTNFMAAEFMQ